MIEKAYEDLGDQFNLAKLSLIKLLYISHGNFSETEQAVLSIKNY
jgi:hypothetical protein